MQEPLQEECRIESEIFKKSAGTLVLCVLNKKEMDETQKNILLLQEDNLHRVVFVKAQAEAGINAIYDPEKDQECYQIFINNRFPHKHVESWEFSSFKEARAFAADFFKEAWEFLSWDQKAKRPCASKDGSCGSCKKPGETSSSCGSNGDCSSKC